MKYSCVQLFHDDRDTVFIREKDNDGSVVTRTDRFSCDVWIPQDGGDYTDTSGEIALAAVRCGDYGFFTSMVDNHVSGLINVYGTNNPLIAYMASNFKYEPDVPLDLRLASFDIEVAVPDDGRFPDPKKAEYPVNAISYSCDGKTIIAHTGPEVECEGAEAIAVGSEEDLLLEFFSAVKNSDPDVIGGWNSDSFDWPYIINRCKQVFGGNGKALAELSAMSPFSKVYTPKHGGITIYGRSVVDYMGLYKKLVVKPRPNYSLDTIATLETGRGKTIVPDGLSGWELWRHEEHYGLFLKYCADDAKIVLDIMEKSGVGNLMGHITAMAHCNVEDLKYASRIWLSILLNYMKENRKIPLLGDNIDGSSASDEKVIGAFTMEPKIGLHNHVASVDMTSLYPSTMMSLNISSDTYTGQDVDGDFCVAPNGACFRRDFYGMFPTILEDMFERRAEAKRLQIEHAKLGDDQKEKYYKNIQNAIKVLLNSAYGCIASKYFPYYNFKVAEAVTTTGRLMVKVMSAAIKKYFASKHGYDGDPVIYSDTDSAYFTVPDNVFEMCGGDYVAVYGFVNDDMLSYVHAVFDKVADNMGAVKHKFRAKTEVVCDIGLFAAKKKYIVRKIVDEGVVTEGGKIKVTGLEANKPSHPKAAREMLKKMYEMLLDGIDPNEFVRSMYSEWRNANPEDITQSVTVSDITANTAHASAARAYNKLIDMGVISKTSKPISNGDKIMFAYSSHPMCPDGKVAWPAGDDCPVKIEHMIDRRKQFEKYVVSPVNLVSEVVGITVTMDRTVSSVFGRK